MSEAVKKPCLRAPRLTERERAYDSPRPSIGDPEDHPTSTLIGQSHAILREFIKLEVPGGSLELKAFAFRRLQ